MPNVQAIIKRHNIIASNNNTPKKESGRLCNCRKPDDCPMSGECLATNIIYEATVKTNNPATEKLYIGQTSTTFKSRFANHKASFKHSSKANQTELSKYVWQLKSAGKEYSITWKIVRRAMSCITTSRHCGLCTAEKLCILKGDTAKLLNKRSEIASSCRHRTKLYLSNFVRENG